MSRPNILCFVTDQHRADHLGCYGNTDVKTPNIDRIASQGVVFTESYVANPVCMPNRASIFTGRYPKAHGLRENGNTLSLEATTLPDVLRLAGYETVSVGKIHLAPFGMKPEVARHDHELYEGIEYWNNHTDLPLPYYGFERVSFVGGHGPYAFGHYKQWLEARDPDGHQKLQRKYAIEPDAGTRECWKVSVPAELHYNTYVADKTIEFLRNRDAGRPFFAWCSFPDPHHPYSPPQPYADMYDPSKIQFRPARRENEFDDLPGYFKECYEGKRTTGGLAGKVSEVTDEQYREIFALTYGMISMVDANIGRVIAALDEQSLTQETIILFLSDHGDLMGDHWLINKGPFLYRGLVRVPTVWRVPGAPGGRQCPDPMSAVDIMPTLLDLAGVEIPGGVQGVSCADLLRGVGPGPREQIYLEYDESYLNDRLRQLRTKDWALTYYAKSDHGLLFDIKNDPNELYNLWNSPDHESVRRDLLVELLRETSLVDDWLPSKLVHA